MASDRRPGGLTALAVINFVLGGLSALGALGSLALIPFLGTIAENAATQDMNPAQRAQIEALADVSASMFILLALVSVVTAALMIASGVGYLKLKKFLGRTLGNAYGVVGIITTLGQAVFLPLEVGGGFNIMVIVGLIYPVLTLVLLNTTFKEDFVN
jgi:hypothetical protein